MRAAVIFLAGFLSALAPVFAAEAELQGFVVNGTVSRTGQDFYRFFSERLSDSELDFNLIVKERPSARWGVLIWVEQDGKPVYRRFLQPSLSDMQEVAYQAAEQTLEQISQAKIQALFEDNFDLSKDEL